MYIGQSNDIQRRFKEHQTKGAKSRIPVDIAIQKYGVDAFSYEVLEECDITQLNDREKFWEQHFQAKKYGYNCQECGETQVVGSKNPKAKLTEADVITIRKAYAEHKRQRDVYNDFCDKISFLYFRSVWEGRSWKHIMPEVFTDDNKRYYMYLNSVGEKGVSAALSDEDVMLARTRYQTESAIQIYNTMKPNVAFNSFQAMLWGRAYSHLPVYSKIQKKWIQPTPVSTIPASGK